MNIDKEYIIRLRREIHQYPEVDFDLPRTTALVKGELTKLGIPYTEKYGKSSVVGYINPQKKGFTIGIRADMDACAGQGKCSLRPIGVGQYEWHGYEEDRSLR